MYALLSFDDVYLFVWKMLRQDSIVHDLLYWFDDLVLRVESLLVYLSYCCVCCIFHTISTCCIGSTISRSSCGRCCDRTRLFMICCTGLTISRSRVEEFVGIFCRTVVLVVPVRRQ